MELKPSLAEAWEQFDAFGDSVVRRIEITNPTDEQSSKQVAVFLNGWDPDGPFGPWCDVRFSFVGVEEYRFWQGNWTIDVVFEAQWAQLDGIVWVVFDGYGAEAEEPTAEELRSNYAYVAAKSVEITVRPFE